MTRYYPTNQPGSDKYFVARSEEEAGDQLNLRAARMSCPCFCLEEPSRVARRAKVGITSKATELHPESLRTGFTRSCLQPLKPPPYRHTRTAHTSFLTPLLLTTFLVLMLKVKDCFIK